MIEAIRTLLEANLNVILTGAPGTGKTFLARKVAFALTGDTADTPEKESHIASVQFHPGYDYSDFVIGMKPVLITDSGKELFRDNNGDLYTTDNGKEDGAKLPFSSGKTDISFRWKDGIFKTFSDKAKKAYDANYDHPPKFVFLIDEINRADLSRVFGELFSLLEEDHRYSKEEDGSKKNTTGIILPNGEHFVIPKNLFIIGTMNDIDRSVESMDFALRRRFAWKEVKPEDTADEILGKIPEKGTLRAKMNAVNKLICSNDYRLGNGYQLGGAIFAKFEKYADKPNPFGQLWTNHIENILAEYLRGRRLYGDRALLLELKKAFDVTKGENDNNDQDPDHDSTGQRERWKGKLIKITLQENKVIREADNAKTLLSFMKHVFDKYGKDGIAKIEGADIRRGKEKFLMRGKTQNRYTQVPGYDEYAVYTDSDTWQKVEQIYKISDLLELGARLEPFE